MTRVGRLLNVLPGEGRLAARLLALMVCVWAGFAIGANGIEGLLFARVGPDTFPTCMWRWVSRRRRSCWH